ncbi:MAG: PaaI family thioesterase [Paucimonas sp.]|nr:PaaI family thioesterase [Paucimonas sp.]
MSNPAIPAPAQAAAAAADAAGAAPKKDFPTEIPFLRDLGAEFVRMENGESEVQLLLAQRHTNSWQVAHGGVVMTLLDVVMSMAARSLDPESQGGITIEMKTSFMQPAGKPGQRIVARGKATYRTKSMVFCEGEVWDGERLSARAMGTFKLYKRVDAAKKL